MSFSRDDFEEPRESIEKQNSVQETSDGCKGPGSNVSGRILHVGFFELEGEQKHGAVARERGVLSCLESIHPTVRINMRGKGARKVLLPANVCRIISEWVRILRNDYSTVVVSFPYLVPIFATAARVVSVPIILDAHNVEKERLRMKGRPLAGFFLEFWERLAVMLSDAVFAVSKADADAFQRMAPARRPVFEVPNGVDTSRFRPGFESPLRGLAGSRPLVCHFGDGSYGPNRLVNEFIQNTLAPAFERDPAGPLFAISGNHTDRPHFAAPNLYVTGKVAILEPYVSGADVIAVPLTRTAGTHLKIVEALGAGQVILTTPEGASGIDLVDGVNSFVRPRDNFVESLRTVLSILPASQIRQAARALARKYDWKTIALEVRRAIEMLEARRTQTA